MHLWRGGVPKAESIDDARRQWAGHLAQWGEALEHNFWQNTSCLSAAARIGWIEDVSFWQALWRGLAKERTSNNQHALARVERIRPFVQEAAAIGNMVPLETFRAQFEYVLVLHKAMAKGTMIFRHEPIQFMHDAFAHEGLNEDTTLVDMQRRAWLDIRWERLRATSLLYTRESGRVSSQDPQDMSRTLDLLVDAFHHGYCPAERRLEALGHFFANAPRHWYRNDEDGRNVVDIAKHCLGPLLGDGIDVELVAMCCGYGPNGNEVIKGIKKMGHHFMDGNQGWGKKELQGQEWAMLQSLYELPNVQTLYHVLHTTQMHKQDKSVCSIPILSVDGMFDNVL